MALRSQSLDLRGWRPWGLLTCLAVLLLLELAVARSDWVWSHLDRSPTGIVDAVERLVIEPAADPVVVVMGNSRMRDAAVPSVIADELGLPRERVLNLSLTQGAPYDALDLYRRHRDKLSRAEVLVLGFDEWQFETKLAPSERFLRRAMLEQRLELAEGSTRLSLLAGWSWRTLDARMPILRTLKQLLFPIERGVAIDEEGRIVWREVEPEHGPEIADSRETAERLFTKFEFAPASAEANFLQELLRLAREDEVSVLVYRPPYRATFMEEQARLAPRVERDYEHFLADLMAQGLVTRAVLRSSGQTIGLTETMFLDYGHSSRTGAEIISRDLASQMEEMRNIPDVPLQAGDPAKDGR